MKKNTNQQEILSIAGTYLGQKGGEGYSNIYDPTLLLPIPRHLNRDEYNISEENLPFVGVDVWNAYEVSAITEKGLPVAGMLKIIYSADSKYHIESKSLKLYLNSFNMTAIGNTAEECIEGIVRLVKADLTRELQTPVEVHFFKGTSDEVEEGFNVEEFPGIETLTSLDEIEFKSFTSDEEILTSFQENTQIGVLKLQSNLLRSNCRVTNQPDWGDVYIHIEGATFPEIKSIAKYIVSHRTVSHFHEEICEMIFTHFLSKFSPKKLMVACLYTRRGGIDINPIRATHSDMIPTFFTEKGVRIKKTLRQ